MVQEGAQNDQNVVIGMFSINSFPASVIFDSGATHSFISSGFIRKHGIASVLMKKISSLVHLERNEGRAGMPGYEYSYRG